MKEMVGGCCVCSDDRGWAENPLVYCDGQGCTVAVHQACYGIVTVPTGNWYCRKCESQERSTKVRCELCPSRDGALKPTDNSGWAHVVCALYIPEVRFGNVTTMEPIILNQIPQERFTKTCYICEESKRSGRASVGACMQCNKSGCRQQFHVTCAQSLGLLCEEAGNYLDNVKYCGYCHHHYTKLKKGGNVKPIPPYRPVSADSPDCSPSKEHHDPPPPPLPPPPSTGGLPPGQLKATSKRKLSTSSKSSKNDDGGSGGEEGVPSAEGKFITSNFTTTSLAPSSSVQPPSAGAALIVDSSSSSEVKQSSKKRKGGKSPPVPALVGRSPERGVSPRPLTPGKGTSPNSTAQNSAGAKPGSIVVQVPLEAAMGSGGTGTGQQGGPPLPPPAPVGGVLDTALSAGGVAHITSPPSGQPSLAGLPPPPPCPPHSLPPPPPLSSTPSSSDIVEPSKRARSQSVDKNEKGRRSKRSSGSLSSGGGGGVGSSSSSVLSGGTKQAVGGGGAALKLGGAGSAATPSVVVKSSSSPPPVSAAPSVDHHHIDHKPTRHHKIKEEKDKIVQNGVVGAPHMLGNQLNTNSSMAAKMCDTLSQEVQAHSIYTAAAASEQMSGGLLGPQLLHKTSTASGTAGSALSSSSNTTNNNSVVRTSGGSNGGVCWNNSSIPQSLDQLLERQWEQGSQFLMEQAQHFDIASLLSCLHQLRAENAQLEEHVNSLLARRDHLLAVNARLAIPLVSQQVGNNAAGTGGGGVSTGSVGGGAGGAGATRSTESRVVPPQPSAPQLENGLASQAEQQAFHHRPPHSNIRVSSQGSSNYNLTSVTSPSVVSQSSVVVRAAPASDRSRVGSGSGGGGFGGGGGAPLYSPSTSQQQTPVVMRRGTDEVSQQSQQAVQPNKPS